MARTKLNTECVRGVRREGNIELAIWAEDCGDESGRMFFAWLSPEEARRLKRQLTKALKS